MHADLVGAAGFGAELDEGHSLLAIKHAPMRDGGLARARGDHPPALFGAADLGEIERDGTLVFNNRPGDDAEVDLFHLPRFERGGEAPVRLGIAGKEQAARGILIEPVNRHRLPLKAEAQGVEIVLKRNSPGARTIDRQAGGLVDHQRLGVFEQDGKRAHCANVISGPWRCGKGPRPGGHRLPQS